MKRHLKWLSLLAILVIAFAFSACVDDTVQSVQLNETTKSLKINENFKLIATVTVTDENTDKTVNWSSSKSTVASVDADGNVTAKAAGTATITAASKANSTKKATCTITVTDPNAPPAAYKNAGTYKVGTELEAGEYLLITDTQNDNVLSMGYYQVTATANAQVTSDDFLYNDNFYYRSYILVTDGQYLKFSGCKLYKVSEYPAVNKNAESWHSGQYKVGVDLDPGEYKLTVLTGATLNMGYVTLTKTPNGKIGTSDFIDNEIFENQFYITLENNTYVSFQSAVLTKA